MRHNQTDEADTAGGSDCDNGEQRGAKEKAETQAFNIDPKTGRDEVTSHKDIE